MISTTEIHQAVRKRILSVWPEVNLIAEGIVPQEFQTENLPLACILSNPAQIQYGSPALQDITVKEKQEIFYIMAVPSASILGINPCREKCLALLESFLGDPVLVLNGVTLCRVSRGICLNDSSENPVQREIQKSRLPVIACSLQIEFTWQESLARQESPA